MPAGKLDQRVRLERLGETTDEMGGLQTGWAEIATVWADVIPLSGDERAAAAQLQSPANYRLRMRRSATTATLSSKDRIIWQGRELNIRFIADHGSRAKYLSIDAEEGVRG